MTPLALITGGQTGLGFGIAQALTAAGFDIALAAISPPDAEDVRSALSALPAARYFPYDLLNLADRAALIDRIEKEMGPISTMISNAGVPARKRGDMLEITPEDFDFTLGVNLRGTFFLAQEVARRMILLPENGVYRSLIFITSVSAQTLSVERAEYCVSKAGAAMTAALFAARLTPCGVGVFELRPGIIATNMTAKVKERYDAKIAGGLVPAGRWGRPQDVADVVVPIAEGRMAFASGAVIPIDGGLSLPRL